MIDSVYILNASFLLANSNVCIYPPTPLCQGERAKEVSEVCLLLDWPLVFFSNFAAACQVMSF